MLFQLVQLDEIDVRTTNIAPCECNDQLQKDINTDIKINTKCMWMFVTV